MFDTDTEPTYFGGDFRTYPAETFTDEHGQQITMKVCEELVDGRWEPFVSFVR